MNGLELAAALLGVACVALAVLRRIGNFAFGIASTGLYSLVFFEAKLYSDALLQIFFVAVNGYGWWNWSRTRSVTGEVVVERLGWGSRLAWTAGIAGATFAWGAVMHRFTDASYPWADAGIAIVSVAAQILMAQRRIENWWLWIAVDCASIPLYAAKDLNLTTGLYMIYLALAVWGLLDWRRANSAAGAALA